MKSLALIGGSVLLQSSTVFAQALISNGVVLLGVGEFGQLNAPYDSPGKMELSLPDIDPTSIQAVGIRPFANLLAASTEPGCLCEGWGVGTLDNGAFGSANYASGIYNLDLISFTMDSAFTSAVSRVSTGSGAFEVTHRYFPSPATPLLYQVNVTIVNTFGSDLVSVQYRRTMDWDIYPTYFWDIVTAKGVATTSNLIHSSDNGFCSSNPLDACSSIVAGTENVDFEDSGPADHGAEFTFEFGPIPAGESITFTIYYGVAENEANALAALYAVGAELYSLGQNSDFDPTIGAPYTFMFGFAGVGGEVIVRPDRDRDGVEDALDNCVDVPNSDQQDSNGDGVGDACDRDGDGILDVEDPDADGDGIENELDNCPGDYNPSQADHNGDGIGDVCAPAPICTGATIYPAYIGPPFNHKFVNCNVIGVVPGDNDNSVTISIVSITQDEPVCCGFGSGNTSPDAVDGGAGTFWVRRERQGNGDGRYYQVNFLATDRAGNSCAGSASVVVSHDASWKKVWADNGQLYDSFQEDGF